MRPRTNSVTTWGSHELITTLNHIGFALKGRSKRTSAIVISISTVPIRRNEIPVYPELGHERIHDASFPFWHSIAKKGLIKRKMICPDQLASIVRVL